MSEEEKLRQRVVNSEIKFKRTIKRFIYDILTVFFILGIFLLEFGNIIVSPASLVSIIGAFSILTAGTVLINNNEYSKGARDGFNSEKYESANKENAKVVGAITGDEKLKLSEFCEKFTDDETARIIRIHLKTCGIDYDDYCQKGYRKMTNREIRKDDTLTDKEKKAIINANKVKVKPLIATHLLTESREKIQSQTELGATAQQLHASALRQFIFSRMLTTAPFIYFGVELTNDLSIVALGWFVLKVAFILFLKVLAYYRGYGDIVEVVRMRLIRKTDILMQFKAWGGKNYPQIFTTKTDPVPENKLIPYQQPTAQE